MEIVRAIQNSGDARLEAKFKQSLKAIDRSIALYSYEGIAFSFNGGKDSTVLLHLLRAGYALAEAADLADSLVPDSSTTSLANGSQPLVGSAESGESSDGQAVAQEAHLEQARHQLAHPITTIYFESPDAFPEIDAFTLATAQEYELNLERLQVDFKTGLERLLKRTPIKAVFLGTRISDPNAVGQEVFAPSSRGWPPFMRVNPILDWSYRDVWAFLLLCKVPYCQLYDHGYTSIGSIYDTLPNEALRVCQVGSGGAGAPAGSDEGGEFRAAYFLSDGRLERAGRLKRSTLPEKKADAPASGETPRGVVAGEAMADGHVAGEEQVAASGSAMCTVAILVVGDEILRGEVGDSTGHFVSGQLRALGWTVARRAVIPNDIDAIAEELRQQRDLYDLVVVTGGVGPTHSDATLAATAKAFGVRLAPDEELEEELRKQSSPHLKMAELPEGITEIISSHHLAYPVLRCNNVVIFSGRSVPEIDTQLRVLADHCASGKTLKSGQGGRHLSLQLPPFFMQRRHVSVSQADVVPALIEVHREFPDVIVGYFESGQLSASDAMASKQVAPPNQLILTIDGKNENRVAMAARALDRLLPTSWLQ